MKERVFVTTLETLGPDGDVIEWTDLCISSTFEKAVEYAERYLLYWPCAPDEQVTVLEMDETDGELDYQNSELLWCSE